MNNPGKGATGFSFFVLWFGAAVSIAEIFTGGLLAPLGFVKGIEAILLGHLIGVIILGLTGIIGTQKNISSIFSTRISFGIFGSYGFSVLNILQLLGWTAVMIIGAARSVNEVSKMLWGFDQQNLWSVAIGLLICIWIAGGIKKLNKINLLAVGLLFILTIVLSAIIFRDTTFIYRAGEGGLSFGAAVELSVIMPLSWLPLISDYTRYAKSSKAGFWGSVGGYFIGSSWMYIIGLAAAIYAGNPDPSTILVAANLGMAALGIVILSTVTTTFLDAYSAGVSLSNISSGFNEKTSAMIMTVIGTVIAMVTPIEQYENFLYAIGSVFAPLFAILLADYYILKNKNIDDNKRIDWLNTMIWILGVWIYQRFMAMDMILGSTLPVMIIIASIFILTKGVFKKWTSLKNA
ncbi:MAG: putative hydroxymethylpyrimidine transporter CytX [Peptococcaceae bacterium]|nr:putative hydroxymethylpyrimidine transporter CytX [Peptococcaceae bacterium]